jgi:hypothetical protein
MLDKPQITPTPDQITAVIRLTLPRSQIRAVMGPGVRELMAAVAAQGIAPTGLGFTHPEPLAAIRITLAVAM